MTGLILMSSRLRRVPHDDLDTLLAGVSSKPARGGRFGRGRSEALEADNEQLRSALAELGVFQRQELTDELEKLRTATR